MLSFGARPYGDLVNVRDVLQFVRRGQRLPCPAACSPALYSELLLRCWAASPSDRPSFATIVSLLEARAPEWARVDATVSSTPYLAPDAPFPRKFVDRVAVQALTGRADAVEAIRLELDSGTSPCTMVCVRGLGGMGKTSAVRKYVHEEAHAYPGGIFWLVADTLGSLHASCAEAIKQMYPTQPPCTDARAARDALVAWLSEHEDWLLVLDNADNIPVLLEQRYVPPSTARGHVLISTRAGVRTLAAHGLDRVVGLHRLPDDKAALLLFRSLHPTQYFVSDTDAAHALAGTTTPEFRRQLHLLAGPCGVDGCAYT